jgi:hypothetical protein
MLRRPALICNRYAPDITRWVLLLAAAKWVCTEAHTAGPTGHQGGAQTNNRAPPSGDSNCLQLLRFTRHRLLQSHAHQIGMMDSWPAPMAQLRLHTRWAGHGIVGDWTYGAAAGSPPPPADGGTDAANEEYKATAERADRMMLHSHRLRLPFEVRSAAPAAPRLRRGAALQMVCNHLSALGPSLAHALCTENRLSCAAGAAPRSAGSPGPQLRRFIQGRALVYCSCRRWASPARRRRQLRQPAAWRESAGAGLRVWTAAGRRSWSRRTRWAGTSAARWRPFDGLQGPGVTPCVTWPSPSQCAVTAVAR